jgi:hypothetical protein
MIVKCVVFIRYMNIIDYWEYYLRKPSFNRGNRISDMRVLRLAQLQHIIGVQRMVDKDSLRIEASPRQAAEKLNFNNPRVLICSYVGQLYVFPLFLIVSCFAETACAFSLAVSAAHYSPILKRTCCRLTHFLSKNLCHFSFVFSITSLGDLMEGGNSLIQ